MSTNNDDENINCCVYMIDVLSKKSYNGKVENSANICIAQGHLWF